MMSISLLGSIVKRIGNYNFMKTLDDRIVFQKTIYFLQTFGLYLNYQFHWYIYGPYSVKLAEDGFKLTKIYDEIKCGIFAEENDEKKFIKFKEFLGQKKNDAEWLELLASLHFLKKIYSNISKIEIFEKVMKKQPYLKNKRKCEDAWEYLKKFNLLN